MGGSGEVVVVLVRSLVGKLPTGRLDILRIFICQRIIRKSLFLRKSVTYRQTHGQNTLANFNIDKEKI